MTDTNQAAAVTLGDADDLTQRSKKLNEAMSTKCSNQIVESLERFMRKNWFGLTQFYTPLEIMDIAIRRYIEPMPHAESNKGDVEQIFHILQSHLHEKCSMEEVRTLCYAIASARQPVAVQPEELSTEDWNEALMVILHARDADKEYYLSAGTFFTREGSAAGILSTLHKHFHITKRQPGGEA